ncbi:Ger(x)C family spore germination protein [Fredinandcohnia sp. 179-A 10B2 NHS]|uniref:Ger(x)C family spore germination protein n=1 Tax=Fredinandcohnia sp. 179-A 10B2 NHS TaxID=3235176 RepID=UPI0039A2AB14
MKKYIYGISTVIVVAITLIYGRVEKEIIDDINVVTAVGFDDAKGEKIKGTAVIPVFNADKSIDNATFTDESVLAKEIINVLQKKSADPLATGGIRVVLYQDKLARKGILKFVDALQRDASVGSNMYLAIVEGETQEVLNTTLGNRGTGEYLATIMEHNTERRDVPRSDLHTFLFRHHATGMDPYLPLMKLLKDKMEITGLGMFQDGRLVYQIDEPDMFFFKAMVENYGAGSYTLNLKATGEYASVKRILTKRDVRVEKVGATPEVNIYIQFEGILSEFTGRRTNPAIIDEIIKELEKEIVTKSEKMLKDFQDRGIDPVGIGYMARNSNRDFDNVKWEGDYPKIDMKVHAKVVLTETGIIE